MTRNFHVAFLLLLIPALLSFDLPANWIKAGSHPDSYDMGVDKGAGPEGKNAATIKSKPKKINGFGTLMQSCWPDKFVGKRVRLSAFVKTKDVKEWAGLWFRVDDLLSKEPLAFDNMSDRPIKGTTDWKQYEVVLDVPLNASNLAYGALLKGTGQVWFSDLKFEVVETEKVERTDMHNKTTRLSEPSNLDFSN